MKSISFSKDSKLNRIDASAFEKATTESFETPASALENLKSISFPKDSNPLKLNKKKIINLIKFENLEKNYAMCLENHNSHHFRFYFQKRKNILL